MNLDRRRFLRNAAGAAAAGTVLAALPAPLNAALTRDQVKMIVAAARGKLGLKYVYGATDINVGTDCSLLTQWCYSQAGLTLPRTSSSQFSKCPFSATTSGTLLFFATGTPGVVSHVGISLGDGTMINANSVAGKVVLERWDTSNYWKPKFLGGRSLV